MTGYDPIGRAPPPVGQPPSAGSVSPPGLPPWPPPPGWAPPPPPPPTNSRQVRVPWAPVAAVALVTGLLGGAAGTAAILGAEPRPTQVVADSAPPTPPPLRERGDSAVVTVSKRLLPSVVQILVRGSGQVATGSGFVLDDEGHIVTNNHVVAGAGSDPKIRVVFDDQTSLPAQVTGTSPAYDLAVLHADVPPSAPPVALGSSDRLQVGERVVAIGSPLGFTSTVTAGIVSALDRPVSAGEQEEEEQSYISAIQTDAAINPGNSGGPLGNLNGQVIGVNSAIATLGTGAPSGSIGVGFAIPIDQARRTAQQIIETGEAVYPVIGAQVHRGMRQLARGALLVDVLPGSPAEEAGLQEGDVVEELNGEPIAGGIELIVAIRRHVPGDTISVEYERDGQRRETEITLGAETG